VNQLRKQWTISILGGIAVFVLIFVYLSAQEKKIDSHFKMTSGVRAKNFIRQGRLITEDLVEEVLIPEAYLQPKAVRSLSELKDSSGRWIFKAGAGLLKGEQITRSRLSRDSRFQGMAWAIPAGWTAMSLKLDLEKAVGGLIRPGDWVNLFCALDSRPGKSSPVSILLLEDIQVLAIENQILGAVDEPEEKNVFKGFENGAITVTLLLTPKQAAAALLGLEKGSMWMTLNSGLDQRKDIPVAVGMGQLGEE